MTFFAAKAIPWLMSAKLKTFLIENIDPQITPEQININKLFGQASYREYFRCHVSASNPELEKSYVIMQLPQGFSSPAEEITKTAPDAPKEFPFINVQKYLYSLEIAVPQIHAYDAQLGLILLQDLGDTSLEKTIENASGKFFEFYYQKVIDLLIQFQTATLNHQDKNCIAFYRQFDIDLLDWEFYHFLEYGIEDRLQIKVSDQDKQNYQDLTHSLSTLIFDMPQGLTHRDFQSRNLMFFGYHFYLIDFQDALKGPLLYDLVALLRDSYININPAILNNLINYYVTNLPEQHPYFNKLDLALNHFHLISLQRKLKDTGRFQYIKTEKNNPDFLPHVPQSLEYVKLAFSALKTNTTTQNLHGLISKYIKELS
ncbi:hypothetical protein BVY03_01800 [bacterium K02(2017)]|nr:hypothetical protein BVY03_01800 [bacterium K02(2017)]